MHARTRQPFERRRDDAHGRRGHAQATADELGKLSGREYVRLCALSENTHPCLGAVYAGATVSRLLDVIGERRTFCPPSADGFPPLDIVLRLSAWLNANPAFLDKPSRDGLSEVLKAMYPCRQSIPGPFSVRTFQLPRSWVR